tara:strand:+ start:23844 stop:24893 length:1050 start_codon:yes stop_codon:yes gene_type:complete
MNKRPKSRMYTLVVRELREYRNSLVITPIAIAATLTLVMLSSILLADRISYIGQVVMDTVVSEGSKQVQITIEMDQDGDTTYQDFQISQQQEPIAEEDWNFSRGWNFDPAGKPDRAGSNKDDVDDGGTINPMLNILHSFMILILVAVTINYLLGCLYNDRKDRSILFWKSMPVSDAEQVVAKLLVAFVAAPLIYIVMSLLTQLITTALSMLLMLRLGKNPYETILGNIDFLPLLVSPLAGWLITALWLAPLYAWILLASAGARRSPFMLAVAPVLALVLLEQLFLGSDLVGSAVSQHFPHYTAEDDAVAFYFRGNEWLHVDFLKMGGGILFAAAAVWVTIWLRRYRFEL